MSLNSPFADLYAWEEEWEEQPEEEAFTLDEIKQFKKMLEIVSADPNAKTDFAENFPQVSKKFNGYINSEIERLSKKADKSFAEAQRHSSQIKIKDQSPHQRRKQSEKVEDAFSLAAKHKRKIKQLEDSVITIEEKSSHQQMHVAPHRDELVKTIKALQLKQDKPILHMHNKQCNNSENRVNKSKSFWKKRK